MSSVAATANTYKRMHTAMRRLGRPEDGRLARLAHVGSLRLSRQQERVGVRIGLVVYDPGQEAQDANGEERRVAIPTGQQRGNGAVELVNESGHGRRNQQQAAAWGGNSADETRAERRTVTAGCVVAEGTLGRGLLRWATTG